MKVTITSNIFTQQVCSNEELTMKAPALLTSLQRLSYSSNQVDNLPKTLNELTKTKRCSLPFCRLISF